MRVTGAQAIWENLVHEQIDTVFGIPGGGVIHLYHALPEYPIRHVLMRHEQAAIHAADGFARCTGRVGVCVVTSGPGATNLLTGLMTALRDSSPVVALTGQSASAVIGTEAFQEVDITGITQPVCKHNYLVTNTPDLPRVLREAFHIARTGCPGPVVVSVAADVQTDTMDYSFPESVDLPGYPAAVGEAQSDAILQAKVHESEDQGLRDPLPQDATPQDTVVAAERQLALQVRRVTQGRALLVSALGRALDDHPSGPVNGSGTPGSALPAAIGMQLARPDEQVWVIESARGFEMSIQELATVVQEKLPIKMVILDGESMIPWGERLHEQASDQDIASNRLEPGLARVASAYGIQSLTIQNSKDLTVALAQAAVKSGPVLLDVRGQRRSPPSE